MLRGRSFSTMTHYPCGQHVLQSLKWETIQDPVYIDSSVNENRATPPSLVQSKLQSNEGSMKKREYYHDTV